jgi:ABC-type multidrug transport system permease subunit
MRALLTNLGRITYLETVFSLRIPASLIFVFLLPSLMLLLLGGRSGARDVVVPGLIGLVTAFSAMQGVGQVAGSMRKGIWQTLQTALHPTWIYFAGVLVSRIIRTVLVTYFLLALAWVAFGYWIKGSLTLHFFAVLLGSVSFACLGLLLGYLPKSPTAAAQWINVVSFLLTMVSGIFFLPTGVLATLSLASPLTYLTRLVRGNAMGTPLSFSAVCLDLSMLAVWGVVSAVWAYHLAQVREDDLG